jgi:AraC-like DNA-binding protein
MVSASQVTQDRRATVTLQLIEGILTAAAAAGVLNSTQLETLQAGVALRSVGVQKSERVSETVLFWLWGTLVELTGSHLIGAELARFASPSAFGVLGEAMTQAASLADAFQRAVRYARLSHQGVTIEIDLNDRYFTVMYRLAGNRANLCSGAAAAGMLWANANLARLPERVFNIRLRPVSVELACVAPSDTRGVIADMFGTDVKFGTTDWRLIFDRSAVLAVSRPVASSALAYLDAYADGELNNVPAVDDIVGQVTAQVRSRLAGRQPTVAEIANTLGLSTRTLQRRLTIADRSFGAVLDEVRRTSAKAMLADGELSLAAIAHKLGYSEHSAFTRATVRWFRSPPSRMR